MGTDIHSLVQRRQLEPRFNDQRMQEARRVFVLGGGAEAWEALHTITWIDVQLLEFQEMLTFDVNKPWSANFINHDPDITPWYGHRNYGLFGVLGGIRRPGCGIAGGPGRGCPEGAEDPGEHSCTWYLCQELLDANIHLLMPHPYGMTDDVDNFIQMNRDLVNKYGECNVRIILSFDS